MFLIEKIQRQNRVQGISLEICEGKYNKSGMGHPSLLVSLSRFDTVFYYTEIFSLGIKESMLSPFSSFFSI